VLARLATLISLAALSLIVLASPAQASVTIGQLGSPLTSSDCGGRDLVPLAVSTGTQYLAHGTGTLTSWSTNAIAGAGQMVTFKVWRGFYTHQVISHDGPHLLTPGALNTFPVNLPIQHGDLIGLTTVAGTVGCKFPAPPGLNDIDSRLGNLADGQSGDFVSLFDYRLNLQAVLSPSNTFSLSYSGQSSLQKQRGEGTIKVEVAGAGELVTTGKGAKTSAATAAGVQEVTADGGLITVRAKGRARRTLSQTGQVKLRLKVTYTPTGGTPNTKSIKVKLKKIRKTT
jgi:hypothetical protein